MSQFTEISAADAIEQVAAGARLIDVREQNEWDSGHAPSAALLPMSSLAAGFDAVPTGERLLVVCHSGGRSQRVTRALVDAGFDAVNVDGGMLAWAAAGGPLVSEFAGPPRIG